MHQRDAAGSAWNLIGANAVEKCLSLRTADIKFGESGQIEDSDALERLKLPVYARGLSPNGCNKDGAGEVGSIVVIFDEDRDNRYPYTTTWLGENQNESDMAFYSTFPFDNIVGPGIGRAEYGGLLMTLPPRRLYDEIWQTFAVLFQVKIAGVMRDYRTYDYVRLARL